MNKPSAYELRIIELIERSKDGPLEAGALQEFNHLLEHNADARRCYIEAIINMSTFGRYSGLSSIHMATHDDVVSVTKETFHGVVVKDLAESAIRDALDEQSDDESVSSGSAKTIRHHEQYTRRNFFLGLAKAVAVLVFAALAVYLDRILWDHMADSPIPFVARVQDQIDTVWDQTLEYPFDDGRMREGRYRLTRGMVEVHLDRGAEIVVEGPAEWSLDDIDRMNLHFGKIYVTVPQEAIGFTVDSSAARVVDLGTEFGLEVWRNGVTDVYTYEGKVQLVGRSSREINETVIVSANEAKQVDHSGQTISRLAFDARKFVRQFNSQSNFVWRGKDINLADIVGGGNGFGSGQLGHVIDLNTGEVIPKVYYEQPDDGRELEKTYYNDQQIFVPTDSLPFVDGLFVPDGGTDTVQITKSGLHFNRFSDTSGITFCDVANGGRIFHSVTRMSDLKLDGEICGTADVPAIYMHANLGVTFDLAAIRRWIGGVKKIVRFTSRCGLSESIFDDRVYQTHKDLVPEADFWVLVDGRVVFEGKDIGLQTNGSVDINVTLDQTNRYLTLAVTEGMNAAFDWGLFVKPVLELE